MPRQRTRRTARTAALTAGALAAALSLSACGDSSSEAEDRPVKAASASTPQSQDPKTGEPKDDTSAEPADSPEASGTAADGKTAKDTPDRTQKLPDGSTANIYETGDQAYRAEIVSRGSVLATLTADGKIDGVNANDMSVVLDVDGTVHAWLGGGQQGPGSFKLKGGWKADVTKKGNAHYQARIHGGVNSDTITAKEEDAAAYANGIYILLSSSGIITSYEQ
ncbi:hypothetical protein [Streptomyces sp. NPDC057718]|uniref:hypothetical protein n=1 Tax=Streptomyces sp. NPDC057718 TaxID=3346225 RepID=UPI003686958A